MTKLEKNICNKTESLFNRIMARDSIMTNRIANLDVNRLGQVFTPTDIVGKMLALRENHGRVLEPSCGDGAFMSQLEKHAIGIEVDNRFLDDSRVIHCDFFTYPSSEKFDTIIGNPPYVRYQDIPNATKLLLQDYVVGQNELPASDFFPEHIATQHSLFGQPFFDKRTNLYLFFINKSIDHLNEGGELIFITPRDFLKATSARNLNRRLYEEGSITYFEDLGDAAIFQGAAPNCAIWRWVKGSDDRKTTIPGDSNSNFNYKNGLLWFGDCPDNVMEDYFDIKVGAVSGADKIFSSDKYGCTEFVCSHTATDGGLRRMIYNRPHKILEPYKNLLIDRKIRKFDETNWWEWGRKYHERDGARIYVNCKTRRKNPFFVSDVTAYDGSVLALFPKKVMNLYKVSERLNEIDWQKFGFVCDGRLIFSQRSLANIPVEIAL